ncbi:MAG: hypothetical protein V1792_20835 [Pseudomonadota bacterium]
MKNKLFIGLTLSFVALLTLVPAKAISQVYYYGTDTGVVYGGSYSYGPSLGFGFGPGWVSDGGYYRGGNYRSGNHRSGNHHRGNHHGRR